MSSEYNQCFIPLHTIPSISSHISNPMQLQEEMSPVSYKSAASSSNASSAVTLVHLGKSTERNTVAKAWTWFNSDRRWTQLSDSIVPYKSTKHIISTSRRSPANSNETRVD